MCKRRSTGSYHQSTGLPLSPRQPTAAALATRQEMAITASNCSIRMPNDEIQCLGVPLDVCARRTWGGVLYNRERSQMEVSCCVQENALPSRRENRRVFQSLLSLSEARTLGILGHCLIVVVGRCRDDEFEEGSIQSFGPLEEIGGCASTLSFFETVVLIKDGEEGQIVGDTVSFEVIHEIIPRVIGKGECQRVNLVQKFLVESESCGNGFEQFEEAIIVDHMAVRNVKYAVIGVSTENTEEMVRGERFSKSLGAVNISQAFLRLDKGLQVSEDLTLNYW